MTTEHVSRQDFEEALREDEATQPTPQPTGREIFQEVEKKMTGLLGSSASDCQITLDCRVARDPITTLGDVTEVLVMMNHKGVEKKAHRQAMLRADRKALNTIGEFPHGTEERN